MPINALFDHLDTIILRVRDLQQSRKWYEQTLELTPLYVDETNQRLVVFDLEGTTNLTIWQLKEDESLPANDAPGSYLIFHSRDVFHVRSVLTMRGVTVGSIDVGGGVISFPFYDPDGNRLEVCQVG